MSKQLKYPLIQRTLLEVVSLVSKNINIYYFKDIFLEVDSLTSFPFFLQFENTIPFSCAKNKKYPHISSTFLIMTLFLNNINYFKNNIFSGRITDPPETIFSHSAFEAIVCCFKEIVLSNVFEGHFDFAHVRGNFFIFSTGW